MHKARVTADQNVRMELYRKAQEIIFEEAPVSPLLYTAYGNFYVKANVKNFQTAVGFKDLILGPDED